MATEEELIAATQNTLGKLITKPKMGEKYLKKPPFRFLHDIVMEVTRSTGFGQGLFSTEESDAANLSDKQAKVDFLNKAIDCVCFALNDRVDVSAGKIVAGLEADKTNLWLQKLHEAATTCAGAKSDEAVAKIQSGQTMATSKEKKKKKEVEAPPADAAPADDGGAAAAAAAAEEEAKKEEDKRRRAEKKKREEEKRRKAEEEAKAAEEAAAAAAVAAASPEPAQDAADAEEDLRKQKREEERRKKEEDRRRREEKKRAQAEEEERRRLAEEAAAAAQAQAVAAEAPAEEQGFPEQTPSAPGSAAQPNRPPPGEVGAGPDEIAARAEAMLAQQQQGGEEEGMGMGRPQRAERPRTAGRKPPKVVSKVQTSSDQPVTQGPVAPTIFAEGAGHDDDDNTFEAPQEVAVVAGGNMLGATDDGGLQGKLVRDLEAQKKKEEEKERERIKKEEEESREEFDDQQGKGIKMGKLKRKKEQNSAAAEVDTVKLGESIQQLCQAANPLGKSIDLVHQDIANMGKELDHWKQEYRDASERYQQELKMTDETLQPLYQKVAELDDKIAEQKTRIRNSRSRISKNDLKIQGLLESVVLAK